LRRIKLRVEDPDNFISRIEGLDEEGIPFMTIQEGELPPRPPSIAYILTEEYLTGE